MGAKEIIFGKILNTSFLKGLRHSAMLQLIGDDVETSPDSGEPFFWLILVAALPLVSPPLMFPCLRTFLDFGLSESIG